jgi:hypothetical protein
MTLSLAADSRLVADAAPLDTRLDVDFSATTGTNNRWMTGLLRPVETDDRAKARGLLSFDGDALASELSVFGAPVLRCVCRSRVPTPTRSSGYLRKGRARSRSPHRAQSSCLLLLAEPPSAKRR